MSRTPRWIADTAQINAWRSGQASSLGMPRSREIVRLCALRLRPDARWIALAAPHKECVWRRAWRGTYRVARYSGATNSDGCDWHRRQFVLLGDLRGIRTHPPAFTFTVARQVRLINSASADLHAPNGGASTP
jgi:hypothetical protein